MSLTRALGSGLLEMAVTYLPGPAGQRLRSRYWRRRLRHLGSNVRIDVGVQFVGAAHISIMDDCWIDRFAVLLAGPPREGRRRVSRRPHATADVAEGEIRIERGCHIASHALVNGHGGVQVGEHTTLAAGSQVVSLSHVHRNLDDPADTTEYVFGSRGPEDRQALLSAPVVIGARAGVGAGAILLPGTIVGEATWIGAATLVRGELPESSIVTGCRSLDIKTRAR